MVVVTLLPLGATDRPAGGSTLSAAVPAVCSVRGAHLLPATILGRGAVRGPYGSITPGVKGKGASVEVGREGSGSPRRDGNSRNERKPHRVVWSLPGRDDIVVVGMDHDTRRSAVGIWTWSSRSRA